MHLFGHDKVIQRFSSLHSEGCQFLDLNLCSQFLPVHRLVTHCGNGSTMFVMKEFPFMLVPDSNELLLKLMVVFSKLMEKLFGVQVVRTRHYIAVFTMMLFLYTVTIALIF